MGEGLYEYVLAEYCIGPFECLGEIETSENEDDDTIAVSLSFNVTLYE